MRIRTQWTMKHPIQAKYLLIVIFAMLAPTIVIGFCFYNLVFNLLALQMVFPEAIMANLVPVIERVNMWLAISLPPLALVVLWVALVISHRFAGPIERLEKELEIHFVAKKKEYRLEIGLVEVCFVSVPVQTSP